MTEGNLEAALASWIGNIYHIFIQGTLSVVSPVLLYSTCFMIHFPRNNHTDHGDETEVLEREGSEGDGLERERMENEGVETEETIYCLSLI